MLTEMTKLKSSHICIGIYIDTCSYHIFTISLFLDYFNFYVRIILINLTFKHIHKALFGFTKPFFYLFIKLSLYLLFLKIRTKNNKYKKNIFTVWYKYLKIKNNWKQDNYFIINNKIGNKKYFSNYKPYICKLYS